MARRPEGPPARGGGRNPGRKGRIGKPPRGKRPPRTTGPLGPPVVGSTSMAPPMPPPATDPLADIFGPTEAYLQGLMLKYKREADRNAAEKQRVAGEYAKWYSEHVPGQIQNIYGTAADQQAGFGKGFSDGFQQAQQNYANESNALLGPIGASDQAIHPSGDATDVLYGIGGAIPGATLSTQGAGFGAAAALMPGAILSSGITAGDAARKAADDKIAEIEGQLVDVRTKKAEAKQKLAEEKRDAKAKAKADKAAQRAKLIEASYESGAISAREYGRLLGLPGWRRLPKTRKGQEGAREIDVSVSKLVGYLADSTGAPIGGKPIYLPQEPTEVETHPVSTTLSANNGYLTDTYGNAVTDKNGKPIPYKDRSGGGGGGKSGSKKPYIVYVNGVPYQYSPGSGKLTPLKGAKGGPSSSVEDDFTPEQITRYKADVNAFARDAIAGFYDSKAKQYVPPLSFEEAIEEVRTMNVPEALAIPMLAKAYGMKNAGGFYVYTRSGLNRIASKSSRTPVNTLAHIAYSLGLPQGSGLTRNQLVNWILKNQGKGSAAPSGGKNVAASSSYGFTSRGLAVPLPGKGQAGSWGYSDPEGQDGRHMAIDWFAPSGTGVVVPEGGVVIEAKYDPRSSGQVFGGTVKVRTSDGRVWVFRHTNPASGIRTGIRVPAGMVVGRVAPWSGSTHSHVELWRSEAGGYHAANMINPLDFLYGRGSV